MIWPEHALNEAIDNYQERLLENYVDSQCDDDDEEEFIEPDEPSSFPCDDIFNEY